jgi:TonB-dependent starch-binding outer membrane protein SusC
MAGTMVNGVPSITPNFTRAAQKDLSWQKSVQWNVGADLEIQNGKYSAAIDVYNKENTLQLFQVQLPVTSGYDSILTNSIGVRNSGVELTLAANPLPTGSKVRWFSRLVISYNKNEIMSLPNGGRDLILSGDRFDKSHILTVGKPINAFYLLKTEGVYTDDDAVPGDKYTGAKFHNPNYTYKGGDFRFADLDGDNSIDIFNDGINPDKMAMGDPNPKVTGGFTNNIGYKNWELSIFCTFAFKRDVLNLYEADLFSNSQTNATNYMHYSTPDFSKYNIWKKPGDNAEYAKFDYGTYGYYYTSAQSFFLEKGGYFRLKSLILNYNLNPNLLRRFKIDRMKVYGVMDNVLMLQASKKLPDAEAVNQYGEYAGQGYPIPKKYTLGFDLFF